MKTNTYLKVTLLLSLAGVLFAGYLSAAKLFTGTCAFNEPCPYFLSYQACWYGLAMFLIMFLATVLTFLNKIRLGKIIKLNFIVSLIGILFSGYFVWVELKQWASAYQLGLPTCVYGLVFYSAIFIISAAALKKIRA